MNAPGIDAARLTGLFTELRLPTIKVLWPQFTEQARPGRLARGTPAQCTR